MVFWCYGILVELTFTKTLSNITTILGIENSTIQPKHHKTTIPSQLQ